MLFIFTGVFEVISSSGDEMVFRFLARLFDTGVSKQLSLSTGSCSSISNFGCRPKFLAEVFSSFPFSEHEGDDGVGGKSALKKKL
jgi:hypothetical protein